MAEFPAMPLWCQRYFGDTRHLRTAEEHGAYLLLLMEAWLRPKCSLPDDDQLLARLACCSDDEWARLKPVVMAFWTLDKRSKEWVQKGQQKARADVARKSGKQSDRATRGWETRKNTHATAEPRQAGGNATKAKAKAITKEPPLKPPKGGDEFDEWYSFFPRKVAKGAARRAFAKARKVASQSDLIEGAKTYATKVTGKDKEYIAHPATWLNGERWLDSDEIGGGGSGPVPSERKVEIAKDWLSRNDDIPTWMDSIETAEALVKEGYDYDRLRTAGFSLPPRGNVIDISEAAKEVGNRVRADPL